jgi:hypothetical protein
MVSASTASAIRRKTMRYDTRMTDDKPPRTTRLYGAVDLVEEH